MIASLRYLLIVVFALTLTVVPVSTAQETTPEVPVPTDVPTDTPTESLLATETLMLTPFPSDTAIPPTVTLAEITTTPSDLPVSTETLIPVEVTEESTPTEVATDTPATLLQSELPTSLPPEPQLLTVTADDFEAGNQNNWQHGAGWSFANLDRGRGLQLLNNSSPAVLRWGDLLNVAMSVSFQVHTGGLRLSVRQGASGSYSAVIDTSGTLRIYRGSQELASAFVSTVPHGQWRTLRLSAIENVIRVVLDGQEVIAVLDPNPLPPGAITLAGEGPSMVWIGEYSVSRPLTELQAETFVPTSRQFLTLTQTSNMIVFDSVRDGDREIFFVDPETCVPGSECTPTQLTFNGVADEYPALSPDGSKITFASFRVGIFEGREAGLSLITGLSVGGFNSPSGSEYSIYASYVSATAGLSLRNLIGGFSFSKTSYRAKGVPISFARNGYVIPNIVATSVQNGWITGQIYGPIRVEVLLPHLFILLAAMRQKMSLVARRWAEVYNKRTDCEKGVTQYPDPIINQHGSC